MSKLIWPRRRFLQTLGLGGAGLALGGLSRPVFANGAPTDYRLVFCYLDGGADQLLTIDPRSTLDFRGAGVSTSIGTTNINAGYENLVGSHPNIEAHLNATGGTGVHEPTDTAITFGPAAGRLIDVRNELTVVRGLRMGTNGHEVGRRYMTTGEFPVGLNAQGSALATHMAAQQGNVTKIPNMLFGQVETFAREMPTFATGIGISGISGFNYTLGPLADPLDPTAQAAVEAYLASQRCGSFENEVGGIAQAYRDSRAGALTLSDGTLTGLFDIERPNTTRADHLELFAALGIDPVNPAADLAGPKGPLAVAALAILNDVCQSISINVQNGLDTHEKNWGTDQAPRLIEANDAIADFIAYMATKPEWEKTIVVVWSEFARTPEINGDEGRDHHQFSSCILAGGPIAKGRLIGGTDDFAMVAENIDPVTGLVDPTGIPVRPEDVHATLLDIMGLTYEHLRQEAAILIDAIRA